MTKEYKWIPCKKPEIGDIICWDEPLRAAPTKPRGLPDIIGEQQIEAELLSKGDVRELKVIEVTKLSGGADAVLKVKEDDTIRRKKASINKGKCRKLVPVESEAEE